MIRFPAFLALLAGAFSSLTSTARADDRIVVETVNYPLYYFAQRLATDSFDVRFRVDPDGDPAFWKPTNEDLTAFAEADLLIRNGADYEKWAKNVSLPRSNQLDTSASFKERFLKTEGKEHRHGNGAVHSHAGTAFTTWIDFGQAIVQVEAIKSRLQQLKPEDTEAIDKNYAGLKSDIGTLAEGMSQFGKNWGEKPLAASHPIYQYLSRAYGLKIKALEWEPEMKMTGAHLHDLEHLLEKHPATWMIWEDEPTAANVEAIAKKGLRSVVFSPCANRPEEGDWLSVMQQNISNLQALLQAE